MLPLAWRERTVPQQSRRRLTNRCQRLRVAFPGSSDLRNPISRADLISAIERGDSIDAIRRQYGVPNRIVVVELYRHGLHEAHHLRHMGPTTTDDT